jgi:hypothetical protein
MTTPVLALPDFNKPFVSETNASNLVIGAALLQDGHPIAYLSQSLNRTNQGHSTYEKEWLTILLAVEKWHSYLQHREFIIHTDQRSLQHLGEQRLTNSIQHKAFMKLKGLQYKIQYKAGSSNRAVGALSHCESKVVGTISTCAPSWQENLAVRYLENEEDKKLLAALSVPGSHPTGFSLVDGLIRYKSHIWMGHNEVAQQHVLQALHVSGIGGHSSILGTYHHVKSLFACPKLKQAMTTYVQSCQICQQAKTEHVKLPGLLQPLPMPTRA